MTDDKRRSRWWAGFEELDVVAEEVVDPWRIDDDEVALSDEQVRFLESFADQPPIPRLTAGLPGVDDLGINPVHETGD